MKNFIPRNAIPIKTFNFKGGFENKLAFENDSIIIYSKISQDANEEVVKTIKIVKNDVKIANCAIVLTDTGSLKVFDENNNDVSDPTFRKEYGTDISQNEITTISSTITQNEEGNDYDEEFE